MLELVELLKSAVTEVDVHEALEVGIGLDKVMKVYHDSYAGQIKEMRQAPITRYFHPPPPQAAPPAVDRVPQPGPSKRIRIDLSSDSDPDSSPPMATDKPDKAITLASALSFVTN